MPLKISRFIFLPFIFIYIFFNINQLFAKESVQAIAFTSCIWQPDPRIWKNISESVLNDFKPDIFIFAGDTVYNDISDNGIYLTLDYAYQHIPLLNYKKWFYRQKVIDSLPKKLQLFKSSNFYLQLSSNFWKRSDYLNLPKNVGAPPGILATWDDHDYGYNDGGSWHPERVKAKQIFQSMFGKAPNSNLTDHEPGIYASYSCGPNNNLQIIMLDCRSFKTPHFKKDNVPLPTILGPKQWKWLKNELQKPAALRLIVSSIPVLAEDIYAWKNNQWKKKSKERWAIFGNEREKFLDLLSNSTGRIVIISGDWHFADISKTTHKDKEIYELTAGGWHSNDPNFKGYKGLRSRFKHDYSLDSIKKDIPPTAWQSYGGIRINWLNKTVHLATYNKESKIPDGYETLLSFDENI